MLIKGERQWKYILVRLCFKKGSFVVSKDSSRAEICKIFSSQVKEIKKLPNSINTMDIFFDLGIHCFYDKENKLLAMEVFHSNKFSIEEESYLNWIGKTSDEIVSYLIRNNIINHSDIEVDELGIKLLNFPIFTIINERKETECCYPDFSDRKTKIYIKISKP